MSLSGFQSKMKQYFELPRLPFTAGWMSVVTRAALSPSESTLRSIFSAPHAKYKSALQWNSPGPRGNICLYKKKPRSSTIMVPSIEGETCGHQHIDVVTPQVKYFNDRTTLTWSEKGKTNPFILFWTCESFRVIRQSKAGTCHSSQ